MNLQLSIVVCTYNRKVLLRKTLDSLLNQTLHRQLYEVVIVDNNSTDGTSQAIAQLLRENTSVKLVAEKKQGLSNARNRGWEEAQGRYVAFIDDDALADKNWAKELVDTFHRSTPSPDVVGGIIVPFFEVLPPSWFDEAKEYRTWGGEERILQGREAAYGFSGSNMAFKNEIMNLHGKFNADFGMEGDEIGLGEETEYFMRLSKKKCILHYNPKIIVHHWTPKAKLKLGYQLRRSYQSYQLVKIRAAKANRVSFFLEKLARLFAASLLSLLTSPLFLLPFRKGKYLFVRNLCRLTRAVGILKIK